MTAEQELNRILPTFFTCTDCGTRVAVDEDGCCATCGRDANVQTAIKTITPAEALLWLAERQPSLRNPCPYDSETRTSHSMVGLFAETEQERNEKPSCCQGREWVPNISEEALITTLAEACRPSGFIMWPAYEDGAPVTWVIQGAPVMWWAEGATLKSAMLRALAAQEQAEDRTQ